MIGIGLCLFRSWSWHKLNNYLQDSDDIPGKDVASNGLLDVGSVSETSNREAERFNIAAAAD